MLPRLDTYNLRLFVSTARTGSIAAAARLEHIAPSALSRRIAELEETLRTPLFVRSPKGLQLTPAGATLVHRVEQINQGLDALVREAWSFADDGELRGLVRLWANPSALIGYLPEYIRAFVDQHPQIEFEIVEDDSDQVVRACMEDAADVGVAVTRPVTAGLRSWTFTEDPLFVVGPHSHPLADSAQPVTLAEIAAYPLLSVRLGGALDSLVRMHAARLGASAPPRLTVQSVDAACRMVEAGMGVILLPAAMLRTYAGSAKFCAIPLAEPWAQRTLSIYALEKRPRPAAAEAFIRHLQVPPV